MKAQNIMFAIASDNKYSASKKKGNILWERPGVYVASLRKTPVYVGYGKNVRKRLLSTSDSSQELRNQAVRNCKIEVYPCDSVQQAQQLEAELIAIYEPIFNIRGCTLKERRKPDPVYSEHRLTRRKHSPASAFTFKQLRKEHAKVFGGAA